MLRPQVAPFRRNILSHIAAYSTYMNKACSVSNYSDTKLSGNYKSIYQDSPITWFTKPMTDIVVSNAYEVYNKCSQNKLHIMDVACGVGEYIRRVH